MKFFLRLILNAIALYAIAQMHIGLHVSNTGAAVLGALLLGVCNALVRPILFLLTLPLTILTLGLFTFVINAVVFAIVAYITPGFRVDSFGSAFWASLIMWIVSWIVNHVLAEA